MKPENTVFKNAAMISERQVRMGRALQAEETKRLFGAFFQAVWARISVRPLVRKPGR